SIGIVGVVRAKAWSATRSISRKGSNWRSMSGTSEAVGASLAKVTGNLSVSNASFFIIFGWRTDKCGNEGAWRQTARRRGHAERPIPTQRGEMAIAAKILE